MGPLLGGSVRQSVIGAGRIGPIDLRFPWCCAQKSKVPGKHATEPGYAIGPNVDE